MIIKSYCVILTMSFLVGSSLAPAMAQDNRETVTVTGTGVHPDALTADLDPTKEHFNGLTGDKISRGIDPLDRQSAFTAFAKGLTGPLMTEYDWQGLHDDGHFRPTREYQEAGLLCRDFTVETDHHRMETLGQPNNTLGPSQIDTRAPVVMGTACREGDGWHFR
jgi:surface antigen